MRLKQLVLGVGVVALMCASLAFWWLVGLPDSSSLPTTGGGATVKGAAVGFDGVQDGRGELGGSEQMLPGLALGNGITVGGVARFDNLQVFPVHALEQHDLGTIVAARHAVAAGRAEIREMDDGPHGAEVNKVSLRNDDGWPMLILGGTIMEGGFQDRLLSGDLLVEPHDKLAVEVYCAERSRWGPVRKRTNTKGRFEPLPFLAGVKIWTAGHFRRDQGRVWSQVDEVNQAGDVTSMTEALLDTLQEPAFAERRDELAARVTAHFETLRDVVGLAYAVNGEVRSVRTFANEKLFGMFRETLSKTAANEALTAKTGDAPHLDELAGEVSPERKVQSFVSAIVDDAVLVDERTAVDGSKRRFHVARRGWGSTTLVAPPGVTAPGGEVPLTTVYVARM